MLWFALALLSPLLYAVVNYADKYLVGREVDDYFGLPVFSMISGGVIGLALWALSGFALLPVVDVALLLAVGALGMWCIVPYFEALAREEASFVIVTMQAGPAMTLVLAWTLLGERLTGVQLLGFVLLLGVALAVALKETTGGWRLSVGFWMVMLHNLMASGAEVLFKFVSEGQAVMPLLAFESLGAALGGVVLLVALPRMRRGFVGLVRRSGRRTLGVAGLNEVVYNVARGVGYWAVALGPVALVSALQSTQIVFGLALGWLLAVALPGVFGAEMKAGELARKLALGVVMLFGVWLMG